MIAAYLPLTSKWGERIVPVTDSKILRGLYNEMRAVTALVVNTTPPWFCVRTLWFVYTIYKLGNVIMYLCLLVLPDLR
jgi:hypothetical protein